MPSSEGQAPPGNEGARRSPSQDPGPKGFIGNSNGDAYVSFGPAGQPIDLAEMRFRRGVAKLHRLGARALAELLAEIGARYLIRQPIEELVDNYVTRLDPVVLRQLGGDSLPLGPPCLIKDER
jgi:hypothetical protein